MEKRAVIAFVLSIGVFYLFSYFFPQPDKKLLVSPVQNQHSSTHVTSQVASAALAAPSVNQTARDARDITVDTDMYTAVFSTRGGALRKLVLKKYQENVGAPVKPVALVDETAPEFFALRTRLSGVAFDSSLVFASTTESLRLSGPEKKRLVFQAVSPDGVRLTKTFDFEGNSYRIVLNQEVANLSASPVVATLATSLFHRVDTTATQGRMEFNGPVYIVDGKLITKNSKDLATKDAKDISFSKGISVAGFADKYFLSALIEDGGKISSAATKHLGQSNVLETVVSSPQLSVAPGSATSLSWDLFYGPKDLDVLKAQGKGLELTLDLGWFSALAKPLLHILKFFHQYTGNYGIAIIIITVIIKVLFFPLTFKSMKSAKEMQKLQPKMNALRDKFKNDRERMNQEIMKLYQEHKVNPLGGCLPIFVQIPVFFALYKALLSSIELRHAPFYFWLHDLSSKDPYYVTPVVMGVTMFIQQKMTPSNMDPTQQKIMLALPVVFTFMFLSFPSGLVLYWLVQNILTIGQQWFINRQLKD